MAKAVQFRRGSANEHENFTGLDGEITVNTTDKTLCVHDGITPGGHPLARQSTLDAADYVIESQFPTPENGYTWYRKYKSGWIEQGGRFHITGNWGNSQAPAVTISLPVAMADNTYCVTAARGNTTGHILTSVCNNLTTTNFKISSYCMGNSTTVSGWWRVEGTCAI